MDNGLPKIFVFEFLSQRSVGNFPGGFWVAAISFVLNFAKALNNGVVIASFLHEQMRHAPQNPGSNHVLRIRFAGASPNLQYDDEDGIFDDIFVPGADAGSSDIDDGSVVGGHLPAKNTSYVVFRLPRGIYNLEAAFEFYQVDVAQTMRLRKISSGVDDRIVSRAYHYSSPDRRC